MKLTQDKELKICSIKKLWSELEASGTDGKTIAILLSMKEIDHPALSKLDAYHKVNVYDTEIVKPFSFGLSEGEGIRDFLKKEDDFKMLYICCDSGESRSTAIAAAIMRHYGNSDKEIWTTPLYHPNMLVYRNQMQAFGKRVCRLRGKYLRYINEKALNKAIMKKRKG